MKKSSKLFLVVLCVLSLALVMSISVFAQTTNEASVNGVEYATLKDALANAQESDTVTLLTDITVSEILVIDKAITFDGNDKTINSSATRAINVSGANGVTIKNVTINTAGERGINIIKNATNVSLEGVNVTAGKYAVNIAGSVSNAVFTIKDSYLKSGCDVVNVAGPSIVGTIENTTIYCNDQAKAEKYAGVKLAIGSDGSLITVKNCEITATGDSNEVSVNSANSDVIIEDIEVQYDVAEIGGYTFSTLQNAVTWAYENGFSNVVLVRDVVLDKTVVIPQGATIVLDLNGKTISQSKECTGSYEMISNKGNLTITGNGKISFTDTGKGDSSFGWGSYTIRNEGNLVIENGTIENLSQQNVQGQAFAHTSLAIFQYSGTCTINGGVISNESYRSVRLWKGEMTINGGTFVGQLWVQCVDNTASLTINGGEFTNTWNDGSSVFVGNIVSGKLYQAYLEVNAGTFNGKIGCNDATALAGAVKGGTFTEKAKNGTNEALLAVGYDFVKNENNYDVVELAIEDAYVFVGFSYSEVSQGIILGYTIDKTIFEKLGYSDFGTSFTVAGADTILNSSLNSYNVTERYDVKITGISDEMADIEFVMALYVIDKNGVKRYLTENGAVTSIDKVASATVNGLR